LVLLDRAWLKSTEAATTDELTTVCGISDGFCAADDIHLREDVFHRDWGTLFD
jgi:hypothetical protein